VSGNLTRLGDHPTAFGGFADVWGGTLGGRKVCVKVLRISLNDDQSITKVRIRHRYIFLFAEGHPWVLQSFFKEAVVWKRLRHPNVVPFLGVTSEPLQFVSEWMPNGTLTNYVTKNPGAKRIDLVSLFSAIGLDRYPYRPKLLDVAEGLNYLHTSYTIHGDLKGAGALSGSCQVTLLTPG
jgi:serine/threonine protein kinase